MEWMWLFTTRISARAAAPTSVKTHSWRHSCKFHPNGFRERHGGRIIALMPGDIALRTEYSSASLSLASGGFSSYYMLNLSSELTSSTREFHAKACANKTKCFSDKKHLLRSSLLKAWFCLSNWRMERVARRRDGDRSLSR